MIYIDSMPNPSGAYPNAKNQPFPGSIELNDEQADVFFAYNGFVTVTTGGNGVTVEPNTDAWNDWKTEFASPKEVEPSPQDDTDAMLIDHEYRLTLLELGLTE